VKWVKFTLSAPIDLALNSFLDIDTEGSLLSGTNDTEIGLYSSTGNLIATDDNDGSGNFSQLTFGLACPARPAVNGTLFPAQPGLVYDGRDGSVLPAGTYYIAYGGFDTTFNPAAWSVTSTSLQVGSITMNINKGMVTPAGGAPAAANLGNIAPTATPTVINSAANISAGGVAWFKFVLTSDINNNPAAPNLQYLDFDTEGSGIADTIMAIFRDDGAGSLVAIDDDDGSGAYSQLTFGHPSRPAVGDGQPYDGRDGATLPAGTYYVAVSERPAGFCNNFAVAFTTGASAGSIHLNIRSGLDPAVVGGPYNNPANNHNYYMLNRGFTWTQAEAYAVNVLHGHLAQIQDADENNFIFFNVIPFDGFNHDAFIGIWDPTLSTVIPASPAADTRPWTWISGEPFGSFINWAPGEPNNGPAAVVPGQEHYSDMRGANGQWNDISNPGNATDIIYAVVEVAGGGVCCRGATCNTSVSQDACVHGTGTAGAFFAAAGTSCNTGAVSNSPCCYANYNKANGITVQDIFDFLTDWFAGNNFAKVGSDGTTGGLTVQNIFDFLSDWFAGGCT
jgi:hypothetical protein